MTISEAADFLQITEDHVYEMFFKKKIIGLKSGGELLIPVEQFEEGELIIGLLPLIKLWQNNGAMAYSYLQKSTDGNEGITILDYLRAGNVTMAYGCAERLIC